MKLLLSSSYSMPSQCDRLLIASAERHGLEAMVISPRAVRYDVSEAGVKPFHSSLDLSDYDITLFRRTRGLELESYQLAKAMQMAGSTVIDPPEALIYPTSKLAPQLDRLCNGYAIPSMFLPYGSEDFIDAITERFQFPMHLKPCNGAKRRGAERVDDEDALSRYLKNASTGVIVQPWIDFRTTVRVLLLGAKANQHFYISPTSELRGADKADVIAEQASVGNPNLIIGADVARSESEQWYVLELNRNPGIIEMNNASASGRYEDRIIQFCISYRERMIADKTAASAKSRDVSGADNANYANPCAHDANPIRPDSVFSGLQRLGRHFTRRH